MSLQLHLDSSGLIFEPQDVINFHLSLKTSPLVILTGISGSGKTKLAQNYIDYMCLLPAVVTPPGTPIPPRSLERHRYEFVSVKSDWLDNKGLLGYYNPLLGIYNSTPVLELLLDAAHEPGDPFFIILDEMNLAKAEYYFSDFLSALESRRLSGGVIVSEPIDLHKAGELVLSKHYANQAERDAAFSRMRHLPINTQVIISPSGEREYFIPEKIQIPPNVYIVGTINIDETTYRFSPKIIDRAHVIEMNGSSASDYFDNLTRTPTILPSATTSIPAVSTATIAADPAATYSTAATQTNDYEILNLTIEDLTHNRTYLSAAAESSILSDTDIINSNASEVISHLWSLLSETPFRFSYRTINRILQYVYNGLLLYRNSGITIDNTVVYKLIDNELLMKVLPRIHGTRKLLEPLLINLLYFCNNNYTSTHFDNSMLGIRNQDLESYINNKVFDETTSRFPRTALRISKLLDQTVKTNYGSFI